MHLFLHSLTSLRKRVLVRHRFVPILIHYSKFNIFFHGSLYRYFFKNKRTVTRQDLLRGFFPSHVFAMKSVENLKYFRVYLYKSRNLSHKKSPTMSCGIITLLALIQDSDFYSRLNNLVQIIGIMLKYSNTSIGSF